MFRSMTAFGRARETVSGKDITAEIKSVNNRYLDCTVKITKLYSFLEEKIKAYLSERGIVRGKIEVYIGVDMLALSGHKIHAPKGIGLLYVKKGIVIDNLIDGGEVVIALEDKSDLLYKVKALAYPILYEYTSKVRATQTKRKNSALASIILYINEHFAENITRESVGHALGYSPSDISHIIELIPNMSFRRLLNSIRVEVAKEYIKGRDMSLVDIAIECGFTSERTFYRAFKEITGMTPASFSGQRA